MPSLDNYAKSNFVKLLMIGESGTGKTGALAALAIAGYKLAILDFDKGVEPIIHAINKAGKPEALKNVYYHQLSDKFKVVGPKVIPDGIPTAFSNGLKLLDNWSPKSVPGADELGKPSTLGRDWVVVLDSVTHAGKAAVRLIQTMNCRQGENVSQPEWGGAQQAVEQLLTLLCADSFATNVIVLSHIDYRQDDSSVNDKGEPNGQLRGNPMGPGRALGPVIPTYFNSMFYTEKVGVGSHAKRYIHTTPNMTINAKNPILVGIPDKLPIETGLATYFDFALGKAGGPQTPPKP